MRTHPKTLAALVAATACALCGGAAAAADEGAAGWPRDTVRLIVPYPPGGSVDSAARVLANALSAKAGRPVVVENKAGADGVIGMTAVGRAPPDGHTLAVSLKGAMVVAPATSKLPFNPLTDFKALGGLAQTAEIYATHPGTGLRTLRDLPQALRQNGNKLSIGYVGALPRMLSELLVQEMRVDLLRVPYKGLPAALQDLIGGQTDMLVGDAIGVLGEQVKAGKIVPLAVTSPERWPALPQVPTTHELGLPALAGNQWYALYGPRDLPPALVSRIHAVVDEVMKQPAVLNQLASFGLQPYPSSPAELAATMREETRFWKDVAAKAKIVPE